MVPTGPKQFQDVQQATDRKPFPSLDGLRNIQRLMAQRKPAIAGLKTESKYLAGAR